MGTPRMNHGFLTQEEKWQTLYPSEIAAFDIPTLREKLGQTNALLTRLSSSLSEARTTAAHYTFQHRLLTIETNEAAQRHMVENEIAKREVEVLRKDGMGISGEQQRFELEEALEQHKKRLRRTRALLRDGREEANELRQENERLKKRIRENRAHRIRDIEAGYGSVAEEPTYEDAYRRNYQYVPGVSSAPPPMRLSQHFDTRQQAPPYYAPPRLTHTYSSPARLHEFSQPYKSLSVPSQGEEDALTTLGLLASQVLSQEGLSEPCTPYAAATRSTTPLRGIATAVPTTPLSQSRNLPGPRTPKQGTPRVRNGAQQFGTGSRGGKATSTTPRVKANAAAAANMLGTPQYTSPANPPSSSLKATIESLIPGSPTPHGTKRRLSTDSTLSAHGKDDSPESPDDSELERMRMGGSPIPVSKRGKIFAAANGNRVAYAQSIKAGRGGARFNKRTRGESSWDQSGGSPSRRR